MTLPNFVVIGSSRSGTTSLCHHLRNHPDVYLPPVLEPRFFAFEDDPMDYQGPGDQLLKERVVTHLDDYLALFDGVTGERAVGEISQPTSRARSQRRTSVATSPRRRSSPF